MHVIAQHISCVCKEQEFEEALKGFQDIYVITGMGIILRHIKLKGDRYIRIQVKDIPGVKIEELMPQNLKEEIKFLPNGKIPGHLLDEIVDFFKAVMTVKKADNEAMAHILWKDKDKDKEDKGYRIAVPNQTVSKASVRYEHDHIEADDVIVLDIHSHNTMGAFFSSTDDGDDKKGIFFSGVVGCLNHSEPEFKWRLNINETKIGAEVEDIFDVPKKELKIPQDWLDKVSTGYSTGYSGGYREEYPGVYCGYPSVAHVGKRVPPAQEKNVGSGSSNSGSSHERSFSESSGGGPLLNDDHFSNNERNFGEYHWRDGVADLYTSEGGVESSTPVAPSTSPTISTPSTTTAKDKEVILPALPAPKIVRPGSMSQTAINQANKKRITVEEIDTLPLVAGEFDANTINFGKDAAEAYEQMTAWIGGLEGADELILNIMSLCYGMLTADGQGKLESKGF